MEVQISFRPIGHIAKLPKNASQSRLLARKRTVQEIDDCARVWVGAKFRADSKACVRERPGVQWAFQFVPAVVRNPHELEITASEGVILHPFHDILDSLAKRKKPLFLGIGRGRLGGDCRLLAYQPK